MLNDRARILVVDDDPEVGPLIRRLLDDQHSVEAVTSASQALGWLEAEPFDLVLCDLMMPLVTGMDLHDRLSRDGSPIGDRMIFMTGGAFTPQARDFLKKLGGRVLQKPFEPSVLRQIVDRTVGGGSQAS